MNIILFSDRRGQVWNFRVRPARLLLLGLGTLLLLLWSVFIVGVQLGQDELHNVKAWQGDVKGYRAEIAAIRRTSQANLDALTLRIGQLQGQLMRLNALGERLVDRADLDAAEFDFDAPAAMGGPQQGSDARSVQLDDFMSMLDALNNELDDREEKLGILESVLMSRSLTERVMPSGRPVSEGWLSSRYGQRSDPFSGKQEFHKGLDFAGKQGSDVIAVADGVVSWVGQKSGYGKTVEVTHGGGYVTRYAHNEKNLVAAGDTVKKGQKLALMGSSGRSTGPHVHLEVVRNGKTVNPSKYVK